VTNKEWFVYDGLGSCRALVKPNAQGTEAVLVARYDYDVYGAVRTQSGSSSNKFKYVAGIGHPTDEETGLIYMRARYYDPQIGRFIGEDPSQEGANWFAYVNDDPANKVDKTGKTIDTAQDVQRAIWDVALLALAMALTPLARAVGTSFLILALAFLVSPIGFMFTPFGVGGFLIVGAGIGAVAGTIINALNAPASKWQITHPAGQIWTTAIATRYAYDLIILILEP
jgi:RHS repeat-associated protein